MTHSNARQIYPGNGSSWPRLARGVADLNGRCRCVAVIELQNLSDCKGSIVTVDDRLLQSKIIFLVRYKLNSPTAAIGELTQTTRFGQS